MPSFHTVENDYRKLKLKGKYEIDFFQMFDFKK